MTVRYEVRPQTIAPITSRHQAWTSFDVISVPTNRSGREWDPDEIAAMVPGRVPPGGVHLTRERAQAHADRLNIEERTRVTASEWAAEMDAIVADRLAAA